MKWREPALPTSETTAAPTTEGSDATSPNAVTATVETSAASEGASESPTGIGTLILLVGLGAIVLVGGVMLARERTGRGVGRE